MIFGGMQAITSLRGYGGGGPDGEAKRKGGVMLRLFNANGDDIHMPSPHYYLLKNNV